MFVCDCLQESGAYFSVSCWENLYIYKSIFKFRETVCLALHWPQSWANRAVLKCYVCETELCLCALGHKISAVWKSGPVAEFTTVLRVIPCVPSFIWLPHRSTAWTDTQAWTKKNTHWAFSGAWRDCRHFRLDRHWDLRFPNVFSLGWALLCMLVLLTHRIS